MYTDESYMAAGEHTSDMGILYFCDIFCVNAIGYVYIGK
jgi:hypothetical protein